MKGKRINWNQVYYFSKVAESGSFKVAAKKLGMSASTLSEHIQTLEKDLQITLFHRYHRMLALTKAGSQLYHHGKKMFETGQRMIDLVSPLRLGNYPIAIGLVPSSVIPVAYRMIQSYLEHSGPTNILCHHAEQRELEEKLLEGVYDFGFSNRPSEMKGIKHRLIETMEIEFYVSKKYKNINLANILKKLPLLVCHMDPVRNSFVEQALDDAGINPVATVATDFPSILYELCSQGAGVGAFASKTADQALFKDLVLIKKPRNFPNIAVSLYVLWTTRGENLESVQIIKNICFS
jgi:DNA-binding transcriptional LysR family regulator